MNRPIIAVALGAAMASAVPAFAGPNGTSVAPFFPLFQHKREATRQHEPRALLGDADESGDTRALPPAVRGKQPARGWLRRPSEGK